MRHFWPKPDTRTPPTVTLCESLFDNLEIHAQTPEPASLALVLLGAAGLCRYVRRRRS